MKIPRAFCITLPERPERTAEAVVHFDESGLENYTFVDGVNADAFGLRTINAYEVDDPGSGFNMGPKPTGIWLSHWMLWQILNCQQDEHFLILEDDVKFLPGWKARSEKAMDDCPKDFDWLFLGSCCTGGRDMGAVKGEVHDVRYPMCFHAYILARKAIPHLLQTTRKVYAPIDIHTTFHSFDKLRVYTLMPRAMDQFNTDIGD